MNWLTSYWRPKIKDDTPSAVQTPENLWENCPSCGEMQYHKTWLDNLNVCPACKHHRPLSAEQRFNSIMDSYTLIDLPATERDPISFVDRKPYTQRLDELSKQGLKEAISGAQGLINGQKAIVAAMDFAYIGGSMGMYVGQAILKLSQIAAAAKTPFICFTASGGARMQEGLYSLMQMPRTTLAVEQLKASGVPFIVVFTNPTMGGVLASFASLGDITIAEPDATIGFSGRRVIENTLGATLPKDFQTSKFQYDCGFIDQIVPRSHLKHMLGQLLELLQSAG